VLYFIDGGSKYSELHDQQQQVSAQSGAGSSVGGASSSELVTTGQSGGRLAVTTDLIDLMSSGSPEYRGHQLASGRLQVRPRPTPPKKTQSC